MRYTTNYQKEALRYSINCVFIVLISSVSLVEQPNITQGEKQKKYHIDLHCGEGCSYQTLLVQSPCLKCLMQRRPITSPTQGNLAKSGPNYQAEFDRLLPLFRFLFLFPLESLAALTPRAAIKERAASIKAGVFCVLCGGSRNSPLFGPL